MNGLCGEFDTKLMTIRSGAVTSTAFPAVKKGNLEPDGKRVNHLHMFRKEVVPELSALKPVGCGLKSKRTPKKNLTKLLVRFS